MSNFNTITTELELVAALIAGGIPQNVAEDVGLVFSVADIRKYVESKDVTALQIVRNVGEKRAAKIIEILKGKIPAPMSKPCPDVKIADVAMHNIPELTLVYENGQAKLSNVKYSRGNAVMKNGEPVRNVATKRFGPALQKLQQIADAKENIVFTTVSEIQPDYKHPKKQFELESKWHQISRNGMKMPNGEIWVPGIIGTNARMKSQIHWIQLKHKNALRTWMKCGANFDGKKVNVAKQEAYFGLLLPYTKELLNNMLNPSMEVITPEWENNHKGKNMLISPNGEMVMKEMFKVPEFDGMVILDISDELIEKRGLTRAERRRLMRFIAKFKGGTLRGPWHKGVIVVGFKLRQFLKDMGVTEYEGKPIDDIAMWCDKSVFKASIGDDGLYEKFEDFTASFTGLQHRFGVLLENHGIKETFLPAQQLQAAHGADSKFVEEGAKLEVEYLENATDPKVAALRYEPNVIARIAQDDPTIMSTWFATEMAKNGYNKEYKCALGGRTHGNSRTGFVIKDLVAYAQWIAYSAGVRKELPTGCLKAYEVYAPEAGITGKAVASRNPVIANYGLPIVDVVNTVGEYDKYFDEGFDYMMVGIHDDLCKLLRMDHDGDKMRLTFDDWFVNTVESIKKPEAFAEWESFGEVQKVELNDETEADFFESCTMSPALGLNVDACGKMIANGLFTKPEHEWLADYMMNKGTDVKQGADGQNVGGEAGVIWTEMKKTNKDAKMSKAMAYGKMAKGQTPKAEDVSKENGTDNLSIIHNAVRESAPRSLLYPGYFDVHKVLYNNTKHVTGLVGYAYNKETHEYVSNLFDSQVARNKEQWAQMDESAKTTGFAEYLAWQKAQVMKEYKEFAEANGVTMFDIYDTITMYIFETLRKKWSEKPIGNTEEELKASKERIEKRHAWYIVLARTYLQWFGDTMAEVYATNTDMGFLPAVDQPIDMEDDIFA